MQNKVTDAGAVIAGISAPAWMPILQEANTVLAFVSGVLSIAFIVWRWWRGEKGKGNSRRRGDR